MSGRARARNASWVALGVLLLGVLTLTFVASEPDGSPAARARRIAEKVKCPECRGLSVADSRETTSEAIRADIRRRVDAGESEDEILRVYADLYGEDVLLEPEGGGIGLVAWGLPVVVVLAAGAGIVVSLRRRPADSGPAGAPSADRPGPRAADEDAVSPGASSPVSSDVPPERSRRGGPGRGAGPASGAPRGPGRVLLAGAVVACGALLAWVVVAALGDRGDDRGAGDAPTTTLDAYASAMQRARSLLAEDPFEALKAFDAAAGLDAGKAEPRAYAGRTLTILARQAPAGDSRDVFVDGARERLDEAAALEPDYADTYAFRGWLHLEVLDDPAGAVPYLQRFLMLTPEGHELRDAVLESLEVAVEAAPGTTAPGTTAPAAVSPTTVAPG